MDTKTVLVMLSGILIRLFFGFLTGYLGLNAAKAQTLAEQIVNALLALVIGVATVWNAYASRKKLLFTAPPAEKPK